MKGITEESLRHVMKMHDMNDSKTSLIFSHLFNECTELNAWQPIDENTPKYKTILIRFDDGEKEAGVLTSDGWQSTYAEDFIESPTHWQELPTDPK